jgi:hypothetical protein
MPGLPDREYYLQLRDRSARWMNSVVMILWHESMQSAPGNNKEKKMDTDGLNKVGAEITCFVVEI